MSMLNKIICTVFLVPLYLFISGFSISHAEPLVKTVDFLSRTGVSVNGAGPLLVRADNKRNRVILVNTYTSSISIIDGKTKKVKNIPVQSRVPQYVKEEALTLDYRTGNIYVIGSKSLHVVFPGKGTSLTIDTGKQMEMVAVEEKTGNAFLAGRDSKFLLMADLKSKKTKKLPWRNWEEQPANLNQTPPPPICKVFCDNTLGRIIAVDGKTRDLVLFSTSGKQLLKRRLNIPDGARWHTAGYNIKSHHLYLVIETDKREVVAAVKIDVKNGKDKVVKLPALREGVGISYNAARDEVYVPYDNSPTVHAVTFEPAQVTEIKIPAFGNDASSVDEKGDKLYVSSWAYGEIDVIDLKSKKLIKRIDNAGILPHMFNMALNKTAGELYIPLGATAVNGSFGAGVKTLDPATGKTGYIHTGWPPVALVECNGGVMVFNSENEAAIVQPNGSTIFHELPCQWINNAISSPWGTVYVSYGPHQSYWPVVYIWPAKNGILGIETGNGSTTGNGINHKGLNFYDRRIPRMAHAMALDKTGALYALQNNWGGELQFISRFPDGVRFPNLDKQRLETDAWVERETTQRILKYDKEKHWLYLVRTGETDDVPGILQVFDLETLPPDSPPQPNPMNKNRFRPLVVLPTGKTPTSLIFNDKTIYIANFDDDSITAITKNRWELERIATGEKPFKLALLNRRPAWINHNSNNIQYLDENGRIVTRPLPCEGKPSSLFSTGKSLIVTVHSDSSLYIYRFTPGNEKKNFRLLHKEAYPYGETTVDTDNSAFYMRGQFGDGIFQLNHFVIDKHGRLWITDFLSGKLFIVTPEPGENNL